MKASVVIPSLNSPMLEDVLAALARQTALASMAEVLVVGKHPRELDRAGRPWLRFIDTGAPVNAARARNLGIAEAAGEVLVFLDSDCLPAPDWLERHLAAQSAGHRIVGGGVAPRGSGYWSLSYNLTLFHEFLTTRLAGPRRYFPTLNLSVHRDVIARCGKLDEALPRGQDIEWTARMRAAGEWLRFEPAAAIEHRHNRDTLAAVWRDCARSGHFMRKVRLASGGSFAGNLLIRNRWLLLLMSPLIAGVVTARIVAANTRLFAREAATIPAVYLTKLAWCWGAFSPEPPRA